MDNQNALELLENLVNIPSVTGQESRVSEWLCGFLSKRGYRVQRQPVYGDRFNLLATCQGSPRVLFSTHVDTVAPFFPFDRDGGTLFGRGVCDAKGAIAAMIAASHRLIEQGLGEVGLLFVVGEEIDSDGARKAAQLDPGAEYVVVGEPTRNQVAVGQKGALVFRVDSKGEAGHSAYPETGRSAIDPLVRLLAHWQGVEWGRSEKLGDSTLNIGKISGGQAPNVIPAEASAQGIIRVSTSIGEIRGKLLEGIPEGVEVEILSASEPTELHTLEGLPETVVSFGSDAPYLQGLGKVMLCGPGSIEYAHRANEQLSVDDFMEGIDRYTEIASRLLGAC